MNTIMVMPKTEAIFSFQKEKSLLTTVKQH